MNRYIKRIAVGLGVIGIYIAAWNWGNEPQAQTTRTQEHVAAKPTPQPTPTRDERMMQSMEQDVLTLESIVASLEQRWAYVQAELDYRATLPPLANVDDESAELENGTDESAEREVLENDANQMRHANQPNLRGPVNIGRSVPSIGSIRRDKNGRIIIDYNTQNVGTSVNGN